MSFIRVVVCLLAVAACGEVKQVFVDGGTDGPPPDGEPACAERACSSTPDSCCPAACNANDDIDCAAVCGNATLEPGERCDPLDTCPSACPAQGCNLFTLEQPDTCFAQCVAAGQQSACQNGDACCPSGCDATNDDDCAPVCGNGVIESGERCDGASCPTSCAAIGCQLQSLQGGGTCDARCENAGMQSACANNDNCCPTGCNATNDDDCAPGCGNNVVEPGETCDPLTSCPQTCPAVGCQQRTLQGGGTCAAACVNGAVQSACQNDDGCCPPSCNANNDDDCAPTCGNGAVEAGETCDPAAPAGQNCVCAAEPYTCYGQTGTAAQCNVRCHQPVSTCTTGGDACCPYNGGGCGTTDPECVAPRWDWRYFGNASYPSLANCRIVTLYPQIDAFGSYLITTCRPPGGQYPQGTGDPVIRAVTDDLGNTYNVSNDDCGELTALPHLAGWDCTNTAGALRMSCASPSPGGFRPRGAISRLFIEICPYNDSTPGTSPVFIWFNARDIPNPG